MYKLLLFVFSCAAIAQPPKAILEPNGFAPIEVQIPSTPNEKLIEVTKAWASEITRKEQEGADFTEITANTITVSAYKRNAFYYRSRGEAFDHKIRYSMRFTFYENRYTVAFTVDDIFANGDALAQYKIADYFTSDGKMKEGYTGLRTSLEKNVNDLINAHYNFIMNFR